MAKNQREQNKRFILDIYNAAEAGDEAAQARLISKGVKIHQDRQPLLATYKDFVKKFNALYGKRDLKGIEACVKLFEMAKHIPIPDYNPGDDFGVMTSICNAANKGNFKGMFRHAATIKLPTLEAVEEGTSARKAIDIVHLFQNAKTVKDKRHAIHRLRLYNGTLTNTRNKMLPS